jgi:hypothetical protein
MNPSPSESLTEPRHLDLVWLPITRLTRVLVLCLLALIVLAVFVPLNPAMPSAGLDPSWAYGMNQAVAQGLVFGKDIVFTFGPYASIFSKMYHPATDRLMIFGSLYLGGCYAVALLLLSRNVRLVWIVLFGAFLAGGFVPIPDSLLMSYPLLLAVVVYRNTLESDEAPAAYRSGMALPVFILLFTPLGLLPLVKVSFLVLSGVIAVLCSLALWRIKERGLAYGCILTPVVATIVFWLFSGQPLLALPYYFARLLPIVSGYSEAMASPGNTKEIVFYLIASVGILSVIVANRNMPAHSRLFLFFSFLLFLFVAFKDGFVRHDGHAIIAATSLLFAAFFLTFTLRNTRSSAAFLLAVFAWAYIDQGYVGSSTTAYYRNVRETYASASRGLKLRASHGKKLNEMFDHSLQLLSDEAEIPKMKGTADIYPDDQAYLLASGNTWSPRPVLQSYSAYTPTLARLDASHLTGGHAPDNVVFRVEPLDNRLPALEDGLSWPVLVSDYSPVLMAGGSLYLVARHSRAPTARMEAVSTGTYSLGETVFLPRSSEPLFAEVDIHQTLIGRLVSLLYKPTILTITLDLENGTQRNYRLISGMAKAGFVISPLVENTEDFAVLFGDKSYWREKRVKAIGIAPAGGRSVLWNSKYVLSLSRLQLPPPTDVSGLIQLDKVDDEYTQKAGRPATIACDASIDVINGMSPAPATATSDRLLSVDGWLAVSGKNAVVPDAVFVTLTDEQGKTTYLKTRRTPRNDVKVYFNHPTMPDVGYATYADVSQFNGKYYLGLARIYEGKLLGCQQFKIPIAIRRDD